jgi:hypothetical protein
MLRAMVVVRSLLLVILTAGVGGQPLLSQSSVLLDAIELHDPMLTADVHFSAQAGDCFAPSGDPINLGCDVTDAWPLQSQVGADGSTYEVDYSGNTAYCSEGLVFFRLVRITRAKSIIEVARVYLNRCMECTGGLCTRVLVSSLRPLFDLTNGVVNLKGYVTERDDTGHVLANDRGWIEVSGLPSLFDTLLTFVPGQTALNILTPAMPDGFRSVDSLQVWSGDVRSMPDWSQARPLACMAAQDPMPGQVVTVHDWLPDPAVGQGRYYLVASQSGPDRRLGRQYVNGAFSARQPAGLPLCQ